jgi:hypothetical protein
MSDARSYLYLCNHGWYARAQAGMHHRMGDKVVQDCGMSKQAAVALEVALEKEWVAAPDNAEIRLEIAQLACFVLLGCARALRGEEITKIELSLVRRYFGDGALVRCHVTLSLIGRFKQVEGEHHHFLPVDAVTGFGLRIRQWVERLFKEKEAMGAVAGFICLKKDDSAVWAADFEEGLVERLEWIQQNMVEILPLTIDLWAEFGVRRSARRGATMDALSPGIDGPTIDANNGR